MRIAVITARGGSKRLPRKNILPFHGKPMIHYPILAAQQSLLFDDVVVSTEDSEIATVAHLGGCQTVIKRPPELANDHATTAQVMRHAVEYLAAKGARLEHLCCIYPCTPMMRPQDLQDGFERLLGQEAHYAFPVVEYAPAVQRMMRLDQHGWLTPVWPQFEQVRSQDLDRRWHDAGQWYWGTTAAWASEKPIHSGGRSVGIPIERLRAIDIDTWEDWVIAEAIYGRHHTDLRHDQLARHVGTGGKLTTRPPYGRGTGDIDNPQMGEGEGGLGGNTA